MSTIRPRKSRKNGGRGDAKTQAEVLHRLARQAQPVEAAPFMENTAARTTISGRACPACQAYQPPPPPPAAEEEQKAL